MMKRCLKSVLTLFLLTFAVIVHPIFADSLSSFSGTVIVYVDPDVVYSDLYQPYFRIPNAYVEATSRITGETYSTYTDTLGNFELTLPQSVHSSNVGDVEPCSFSLHQNFPNPFNPETTLSFDLHDAVDVSLKVYNINGQLISTLVDEYLSAGTHFRQWGGTDDNGNGVASGVYFYRLNAGKWSETKKMLLIDGHQNSNSISFCSSIVSKKETESKPVYDMVIKKDGYEEKHTSFTVPDENQNDIIRLYRMNQLDYFPLSVGNSWTFALEGSDDETDQQTFSIIGQKTFDGEEYYLFDSFPLFIYPRFPPHVYPEETLVRKGGAGAFRIWEGTTEVVVYMFSLTFPSSEAIRLRIIDLDPCNFYINPELRTTLDSTEETVLNYYPCYMFCTSSMWPRVTSADVTFWFAPGIGPIKVATLASYLRNYYLKKAHINGVDYTF